MSYSPTKPDSLSSPPAAMKSGKEPSGMDMPKVESKTAWELGSSGIDMTVGCGVLVITLCARGDPLTEEFVEGPLADAVEELLPRRKGVRGTAEWMALSRRAEGSCWWGWRVHKLKPSGSKSSVKMAEEGTPLAS